MLPREDECARLDQLLDRLIDASEPMRAAALGAVQREQPQLHASLVELLKLAEHTFPALDPQRLDRRSAWQTLVASPDGGQLTSGARIGAWRVVRHLGCGGMGNVYEVERADGAYAQRAALKLILNDIDSREFLERFSRERQILAALDHPGIARLIDGGEDSRRRPYLVMEYVDGQRIDRYCELRRLDLNARLQLFLQVASAIEHAHQRRIVHRDLKPSNIAVTESGTVKLLDFGIAKVLENETERNAARTAVVMLTPEYSTPEQVLGQPVDSRSDIYQLGLLLFELLVGQRAQKLVDGTPRALLQTVCVEDRTPPSACAAATAPLVCETVGGLTPPALARKLRGDLDWIVLQALRREPVRRYCSVAALSEDVQRHLSGMPVRARPETCSYRVGKFVRRHRWGVASTAAAFLLMIAYGLTATIQARLIAAERDRATTQARMAEQVKALVLSIFAGANPEHALGKELTARELLDSSWPKIEAETSGQPLVQIEILDTIAETYRQLGSYEQARQRLAQAQALIAAYPRLPSATPARHQRSLGRLLTETGEYESAETALQRAQMLFREREDHVELAATLKDLGHLEHKRGRNAEAAQVYRGALAIYRNSQGDHRRAIADGMERLAVALTQQGNYPQAATLLQETLVLQRQLLPEGHPDIAGNQANLAEAERRLGRYESAEALYRQALSGMQRSRGSNHPFVATIMNNLARVLIERGSLAPAETLLEEALVIRTAHFGEEHELVAMSLSDLGSLSERRGNDEAAQAYYRRALAILPETHRWRGPILANVGRVLHAQGDLANAERLYRESLQIKRVKYGDDHDMVGTSLQQLAAVLHAQGRSTEAEAVLHEALRIFRSRLDPAHPHTTDALRLLSQVAVARGQGEAATSPP